MVNKKVFFLVFFVLTDYTSAQTVWQGATPANTWRWLEPTKQARTDTKEGYIMESTKNEMLEDTEALKVLLVPAPEPIRFTTDEEFKKILKEAIQEEFKKIDYPYEEMRVITVTCSITPSGELTQYEILGKAPYIAELEPLVEQLFINVFPIPVHLEMPVSDYRCVLVFFTKKKE